MEEQTVAAGYDRIADQYLATKQVDDPIALAALERLADGLPPAASVLDLSGGAGVPATRWLAQRVTVTGVDVSARQMELAHQHVPQATLLRASMTEVAFAPAQFAAVVALHSIIHNSGTTCVPGCTVGSCGWAALACLASGPGVHCAVTRGYLSPRGEAPRRPSAPSAPPRRRAGGVG